MAKQNPLGNLPPKAARMWEHVYESSLERGLSKSGAAASAWCAVKRHYYKKGERWHKRKDPLSRDEYPPGCEPFRGANPIEGMPGGSVSGCIEKYEDDPDIDDAGAYCAAIADRIEPGWREENPRKMSALVWERGGKEYWGADYVAELPGRILLLIKQPPRRDFPEGFWALEVLDHEHGHTHSYSWPIPATSKLQEAKRYAEEALERMDNPGPGPHEANPKGIKKLKSKLLR